MPAGVERGRAEIGRVERGGRRRRWTEKPFRLWKRRRLNGRKRAIIGEEEIYGSLTSNRARTTASAKDNMTNSGLDIGNETPQVFHHNRSVLWQILLSDGRCPLFFISTDLCPIAGREQAPEGVDDRHKSAWEDLADQDAVGAASNATRPATRINKTAAVSSNRPPWSELFPMSNKLL